MAAFSETFSDRNIGTSKSLTPSGTVSDGNSGNNYSYTFTAQNNGTINAKELTVSGITAASTVYDATTNAKLGGSATFLTVEPAGTGTTSDGTPYTVDSVSPGSVSGTLAAKDVGPQTVTTTVAVSGTGSGNYIVSTQAGLIQTITAKPLNYTGISAANNITTAAHCDVFRNGLDAVGKDGGQRDDQRRQALHGRHRQFHDRDFDRHICHQ